MEKFEQVGRQEHVDETGDAQEKNEWEKMADEVRREQSQDTLDVSGATVEAGDGPSVALYVQESKADWLKRVEGERRERRQEQRAEARAERRERMREQLRGIGQKIMQVTGINMIRGTFQEIRRNRERAQHEGQTQLESEQIAKQETAQEYFARQSAEKQRQEEEKRQRWAQEAKQREDEYIADNIGEIRAKRAKEKLRFLKNRMEAERKINDKLTSMEEIMAAAETGTDAELVTMKYGDKEIPVCNMQGYPIAMLSHDLGYKVSDTSLRITGRETAKRVFEDPSIWTEDRPADEVLADDRHNDELQRGNTLSTSFYDSETMKAGPDGSMNGVLGTTMVRYGFDHVRPDSLVKMNSGDASTARYMDEGEVAHQETISPDGLDQLAQLNGTYNEVAMLRYDDQGKPMLPDYLVTVDGKITEDTLRHAAFFGVPIVNIEKEYYTSTSAQE